MILLRAIDPDQPIVVSNAEAIELEEPPADWLLAEMAYVIETTDVEITVG